MKRYQQTVTANTTNTRSVNEGGLSSLTYIFPYSPGWLRGTNAGVYVALWNGGSIYNKPEIVTGATLQDYKNACITRITDEVYRSDYFCYNLYDFLKTPEEMEYFGLSDLRNYASEVIDSETDEIIYSITNDNGNYTEYLKEGYTKGNIYMAGYYLMESATSADYSPYGKGNRMGFLADFSNYAGSTEQHFENGEYINSLNLPGYGYIETQQFVTNRNVNIWYGIGSTADNGEQQSIPYYPRLNQNNNTLPEDMNVLNAGTLNNCIKVQQYYYPGQQRKKMWINHDIDLHTTFFPYAKGVLINDMKLNKYLIGNYGDVYESSLFLTAFYDEIDANYKKIYFCFVLIGGA